MNNEPSLTLGVSGGSDSIVLESACLLVFIDETGDELFSDPQHSIFGLGGCAVLVGDYVNYVRPLWCQMKDRYFGGANVPFHANEFRTPTTAQLDALNNFFLSKHFARIAAVASGKSQLPDEYSAYQLISRVLLVRIEHIASRFSFSRIVLLIESSKRANILAVRHLGPYNKAEVEYLNHKVQIPIDHYFAPKTMNEPGMEIADFIMHAVGRQVRYDLTGSEGGFRKDFIATFQNVPRELVEYLCIKEATVNETSPLVRRQQK